MSVDDEQGELELFDSLLGAKLMIIAYDCDFNFEPCNKRGRKAHWALIVGYLLPVDACLAENYSNKLVVANLLHLDAQLVQLGIDDREKLCTMYKNAKNNGDFSDNVYAICMHGKSKHLGVWRLKSLLSSNKQLEEIDHEKCSDEMFVKPSSGDLKQTLSSRVIVFN
jgi:hypothetical protein